ncbi:hypothetical protein [Kribbella sp. CA-247076]|uniref:hypothetical protein n=1 Tax=Kribbella sp. CA-247076 TaxID=3239941 RepID=UPI003D93A31E
MTTPLQGPAKAGPASASSAVGTVGAFVVVVGAVVGFGLGEGVEAGFFEGAEVAGADGGTVAAGALEVVRWDGRTPEVAGSPTSRDFAASVAFVWLAMTGSATVTTASAAAISAANHNFLNAPSGVSGAHHVAREVLGTRCSHRET